MQSTMFKTNTPVAVSTTLTKVLDLNLGGLFSRLAFQVKPVGADLDSFVIRVRTHPDGDSIDFLSDIDFDSTAIAAMRWATTMGPHQVTDGLVGAAIIDLGCVHSVELWAKTPVGTANVTILGTQGQEG